MNISIFGLGYVGCVSLGCLAKSGHKVIGVDLDKIKFEFINSGQATIVENEIDLIISEMHKLNRITATNDSQKAVENSEVSLICVGTPSTTNGHLNLDAIFNVAKEIGKGIKQKGEFHIIAIRSTVMPGTNDEVSKLIEKVSGKISDKDFAVVSNPEFLREGSSVKDYFTPPYTLIGTKNEEAIEKMREIYKNIDSPFIVTDIKIAEFIKYVNNAFHALKITFANEIGNICKKLEIDSHQLMDIFCRDTKLNISPYYLKPGFCFGGSCLPKDLKALRTIAHDQYMECPVIENIERSNDFQKSFVLNQIIKFGKEKIGFLGVSFKAGTDDLRNSPIIDIIEQLLGKGYDVKIYDNNVQLAKLVGANREFILKKIPLISKFIISKKSEIIEHSDLFVVVNKEDEFSQILDEIPNDRIVYDLVNIDFNKKDKMNNLFGISW